MCCVPWYTSGKILDLQALFLNRENEKMKSKQHHTRVYILRQSETYPLPHMNPQQVSKSSEEISTFSLP